MPPPLKLLFLGAEAAPFAKTGGLGDVVGALPKALAAMGHDVRVAIPAYQSIETAFQNGKWDLKAMPWEWKVPTGAGLLPAGLLHTTIPGSEVPIYFVAERNLFGRSEIYGYDDDPYRFCFFSRAALDLVAALNWKPDVIHAHDWHAAPALMWLATTGQWDERYRGIASLFTIHNLAHQGLAPRSALDYLVVNTPPIAEDGYGAVNFMARGIFHATLINTVSPTYAREIISPDGGARLDGLLRFRHYDVHGILNGLDFDVWNSATDVRLAQLFDADTIDSRLFNKRALQERAGLPQRDDVPLVAMVSRLDWQKGLDIMGHVVHLLMNGFAGEAQFVVLGTGVREYEEMFARLAGYHKEKMTAFLDYDANLAPLIYGGADIFLMPSRFEPCGLGQLIAMHYGCVPVVRATGGLADTVRDGLTGFTFYDYSVDDFWRAVQRAIYIYSVDKQSWRAIQHNGMTADFSWQTSAVGYQQLYEWAMARVRGG
ncbi:MAG TPA: glycogen synthase [Anaerolineales bacterium]|nr:glycogen synthase [Anaerolineales bacterium]